MAISEQWAYLLDPGLRAIFEAQRTALAAKSVIPALFNVSKSEKAIEYDLGVGGMADFDLYEGRINYDEVEQLYRTSYAPEEYTKGWKVERKLVDDDLYNVINKRPRAFATSAMRTREKHGASVFNNAFSSSYVGADAVSLCNDSHPYSPSNTSTQDNKGTTALSYSAVVDTITAMQGYKDDRGELISVDPDILLVPTALGGVGNSIVKTMRGADTQQPDTADYSANYVQEQGIRLVVWRYLTDANNWFLIDSELAKLYLNWFDRVPLEVDIDPTSNFSLEARWRGYMRYSFGWSDWRFVYGHEVA